MIRIYNKRESRNITPGWENFSENNGGAKKGS